jgi:hypothetical protein
MGKHARIGLLLASACLLSKLTGRCHHRPFRFKVFPPNERWLTVHGEHPDFLSSYVRSPRPAWPRSG